VNEADLLNMRLSPDMFNLARQVRAATDPPQDRTHVLWSTSKCTGWRDGTAGRSLQRRTILR